MVTLFELQSDRLTENGVAAGPAIALLLALGMASVMKSRLLGRLLGARVQGWRWPLVGAAAAAASVGYLVVRLPRFLEFIELIIGIPLILVVFGIVVWRFGFTDEDRILFRLKRSEGPSLPPPRIAPRDR
jgi:hypothetical protein